MDLRQALKEQYHGGLAMLAECVERCPDDLWVSGIHPRSFWRVAFHAAFFAQLYLGQDEAAFKPWSDHREDCSESLSLPAEVEPYELPAETPHYSREEMLNYIDFVDALVDPTVDALDLDAKETGFPWYRSMGKLSHELMNLRHLQGHVGQLSERLMDRGIDTGWIGRSTTVRHALPLGQDGAP